MSRALVLSGLLLCLSVNIASATTDAQLDKLPWRRIFRRAEVAERRALESTKEDEEAEAEEAMFKWTCVVGLLALAGTFVVGQILESRHITRLPEAGVGVIMGILASGAAVLAGNEMMVSIEKFDFEFFMVFLLPPIIFEAGFNMNVKAFVDNMGPTMFFAFIGTFGSTFVVGGLVYFAGQLGLCYPLGLLAALVFGSLISATDPVTVLAVFQALGVQVDLFSMVFGESVLNDAVAIVLSKTLLSFNEPGAVVNTESVMGAVSLFLQIFIGSLIIGLVYGLASALVFKKLDLRHHEELLFIEAALSFVFPWAAYYTAEAAHLSGIVTILFCGMVMAIYTRHNFSPSAIDLTAKAFKCVALIAETYVFVYLGMAVFAFPIFSHTVWKAMIIATLACFVGRLHIYIGSWLFNCFRSTPAPGEVQQGMPKISAAYTFIMWFSGLRGGVAFAIASVSFAHNDFPANCGGLAEDATALREQMGCDGTTSDSLAIMQITLLIALFTIFVFGGAITEVAVAYKVLEDKKKKKEPAPVSTEETAWTRFNKETLLPFLTFAEVNDDEPLEDEARFGAAIAVPRITEVEAETNASWAKAKAVLAMTTMQQGLSSKEIKAKLTGEEFEMAVRGLEGVASVKELSMEDKVDDVRHSLPALGAVAVKKLLEESDGDVAMAIRLGQSRGFE